ncbi:hypothetical protein CALVIDRAFT_561562 [Calocera viscosa TUFC12733]|uniref:Uncharacterized protein n=1 Tax=Calocera viscosa (strain TUFC12733) TaxID=1330018 RepID=A0A167PVR3_CALVF|nr:hypothetical protein CALVIDRAFT_561562 [Calocera viscosa TUFC12733]
MPSDSTAQSVSVFYNLFLFLFSTLPQSIIESCILLSGGTLGQPMPSPFHAVPAREAYAASPFRHPTNTWSTSSTASRAEQGLFTVFFFLLLHVLRVSLVIAKHYLTSSYNYAHLLCSRSHAKALLVASYILSRVTAWMFE